MTSLNLNINSWSRSELEKLLNISSPYTTSELSKKTNELENTIKLDSTLDKKKQAQIVLFLTQVNQKLNTSQNDTVRQEGSHFLINNFSQNIKDELQNGSKYPTKSSTELMGRTTFQPLSVGTLNPINRRTTEETINIDSRFRDNYYNTNSTNMIIQLPFRIKNVITMHLTSVSIPISYHYISKELKNNTFVIELNDANGNTSRNVFTIPDGRYEPAMSMAQGVGLIDDVISTLIQFKSDSLTNPPFPEPPLKSWWEGISYNVDPKSGRSSFRITNNLYYTFKILFNVDSNGDIDVSTPLQLKLGWMLGYRLSTYIFTNSDSSLTLNGPAIISEGLCHIKGPDYMYLSIDDYNNNVNNYFKSAFTSSILNDNIISRINSTASIGFSDQRHGIYQIGNTDLFTSAMGNQRTYFGPVDIERLHIELLDEYGRHINLNNMDWSLTIGLETIYKN